KREGGPADEEPPTTHQQPLYHADRAASPRGARRGQSALAGRGAGDRHDVRAATLQLVAADQVVVARVELDGAVDLALAVLVVQREAEPQADLLALVVALVAVEEPQLAAGHQRQAELLHHL